MLNVQAFPAHSIVNETSSNDGRQPPPRSVEAAGTSFAICVLENDRNEILLLKRAASARLGPGKWGFPAGHIEARETPLACARRELREEIGGHFKVKLMRVIGPLRDSLYGGDFVIHLFHYRWLGGRIELNHEHTGYAWVGKDRYQAFEVMDGIDEDLAYLDIWPREVLSTEKLPAHLHLEPPRAR
jgi:8-oxo-dGTP diphosphatase